MSEHDCILDDAVENVRAQIIGAAERLAERTPISGDDMLVAYLAPAFTNQHAKVAAANILNQVAALVAKVG